MIFEKGQKVLCVDDTRNTYVKSPVRGTVYTVLEQYIFSPNYSYNLILNCPGLSFHVEDFIPYPATEFELAMYGLDESNIKNAELEEMPGSNLDGDETLYRKKKPKKKVKK